MPDRPPPEFSEIIKELDHGNVHGRITSDLADLVGDVVARRKTGKLVIELQVTPADDYGRNVTLTAKVTSKPPPETPTGSIFFPDLDGGLHRNDPYSEAMIARDVATGAEVARDLLNDTNGGPAE